MLDQSSAVEAVIDKFGTSDTAGVAEDFNPEMAMFAAPGSPIARYMTEDGPDLPAGVERPHPCRTGPTRGS